jgi:hypothetical protein
MTIPNTLRSLLGVGLLFGVGLAVRADDTVTFQVDLTRYTNSAGQQAATLVDVRGAFNGWNAGSTLVNNGVNVYTNTFPVVGNTGDKFQYKFTYTAPTGVTWEDNNPPPGPGQPPDEGNNRVLALVGGAQTLPVVPFYAPSVTPPIDLPTNSITYRVDLTEQVQLGNFLPGDAIRVTGNPVALTSWGAGVDMTNNPALSGDASNIYSAVVDIQGAPGTLGGEFKFRMNSGWEELSEGGNRNFTIIGGPQVLAVYYYFDQPIGPATNANVTFQVDMSPQVISGGFTNGVSAVTVSGLFNGWSAGTPMTNDPALSGNASNVYSTTISIANQPGVVPTTSVGLPNRYKFRADGGWESAAIYGVGGNRDRRLFIEGGDQILPLVTYDDASLCDVLLQPTMVTFVVHLPNGTLDNNGIPFDKANDTVWINGPMLNPSWAAWNTNECVQVTNNPVGSDFYEQTLVIPGGSSRRQLYKFGLDGPGHGGLDNENPTYSDHVKYVRNNSPAYTLPAAEFGNLHLSTLVEPVFGDLKIGAPSGGNVSITWLGGTCTTLQTRTNLSVGSWIDLPTTDATSSTNWPITGVQQYFRLQRRPFP